MRKLFFFISIVFFIQPVISLASDEATSKELIEDAKKSYKQAVKLNNPWRDTNKIIKRAEKAHNNKKYKKSVRLAKEALNQAKMAIEQHNSQKDNYRFLDD